MPSPSHPSSHSFPNQHTHPTQTNQTWQALKARQTPAKRPFVLTRSFYAGSQRWGAMWTGDNLGTWEHMAVGIKMVLANGIAGMTFAGCELSSFCGLFVWVC